MENFANFTVFDVSDGNASSYSDNSTVALHILWTCLLSLVAIISCIGNFLVCFTLYRRKYLLTSSNKLVFSLTSSNFAFGVLVFPFGITSSITRVWLFGKVWCSLTGFLTTSLFGASILTLSLISYDRYYAVVHPLKYPNHISSCRVTAAIILCWMVSLCCAVPPLFGAWSQYQFIPARFGCFPLWAKNYGFSLFWILICSIFPLFCVVSMYCKIFSVARDKYKGATIGRRHIETSASRQRLLHYEKNAFVNKNASGFEHMEKKRLASKTRTTPSPSRGFYELQATLNPSYVEDSGIVSTEYAGCSQQLHSVVDTSPHEPMYEEKGNNSKNQNANASSYSGTRKSLKRPPSREIEVFTNGRSCSVQSRVLRNDSLSSSTRSRRQLSFKRNFRFSYFRYYKNQRKACCTISVIVGFILVAVGPFIIVSLVETFLDSKNYLVEVSGTVASYRPVAVADWLVSISTILMYTTCVYYPVIYGLWNETVRQEMMSIICGKSRGPQTRRTRILSISTHIKDLGLSPRITAAIMDESAAMAAVVYPMQVETKSSKKARSSSLRKISRTEHSMKSKHPPRPPGNNSGVPDKRPTCWKQTHHNVLEDTDGLNVFKHFLEESKLECILECWLAMKGFKSFGLKSNGHNSGNSSAASSTTGSMSSRNQVAMKMDDETTERRFKLAKTIYKKFLSRSATNAVSSIIKGPTKSYIGQQIKIAYKNSKGLDSDLFHQAQTEIELNMEAELHSKFLNSDNFIQYSNQYDSMSPKAGNTPLQRQQPESKEPAAAKSTNRNAPQVIPADTGYLPPINEDGEWNPAHSKRPGILKMAIKNSIEQKLKDGDINVYDSKQPSAALPYYTPNMYWVPPASAIGSDKSSDATSDTLSCSDRSFEGLSSHQRSSSHKRFIMAQVKRNPNNLPECCHIPLTSRCRDIPMLAEKDPEAFFMQLPVVPVDKNQMIHAWIQTPQAYPKNKRIQKKGRYTAPVIETVPEDMPFVHPVQNDGLTVTPNYQRRGMQPFAQDPTMPILDQPDASTTIQEVKRRLIEETDGSYDPASNLAALELYNDTGIVPQPLGTAVNNSTSFSSVGTSLQDDQQLQGRDTHSDTDSSTETATFANTTNVTKPTHQVDHGIINTTTVVYYLPNETIAYKIRLPYAPLTLGQFKAKLPAKCLGCRFYFKKFSQSINKPTFFEFTKDDEVLPLHDDIVIAKLKFADPSQ